MSARCPLHRRLLATAAGFLLVLAGVLVAALGGAPVASAASNTTAWQNGAFSVNTGGVVSRSDVVLGQPNTADSQSLPLGNGSLGVAAWAANGFTAQLNRSDTMPDRLSPGQVQIPGLAAMTSASNFTGTLDLYNGVLNESGGGMTMQAWVPAGKDELIVNVTGANPSAQETADLHLWSGRTPTAAASGAIGSLAQTWVDNSQTGSSGQTFGAMSRDHRRRARTSPPRSSTPRGAGLLHPELQRLVPGRHRRARVDRRQRRHHRLDPDRQRRHHRRVDAAGDPVVVVERLLGQRRADRGELLRRHRAVHGEPAHPLPLRRGRLDAQRGLPGQPGRRRGHVRLRRGPAGLVPGRVLAVEPARPDRREPVLGQLQPQPADLQHVPQRPARDRVVDQRADGRADRGVRAGDDAVQRQRLLQRRHQLPERLLRHRVQPELQRRGHHLRRRARAVDLAAVPGHRQPQLPADSTTRSWSRPPSSCSPTRRSARTATCTPSPTRTRPSGRCRTRPPTWPPTRPCSRPSSAPPPC